MDEYLVPSGYGEDEFTEKKSRFIGRVWLVETEEEALEKIGEMKKKHYDVAVDIAIKTAISESVFR